MSSKEKHIFFRLPLENMTHHVILYVVENKP